MCLQVYNVLWVIDIESGAHKHTFMHIQTFHMADGLQVMTCWHTTHKYEQ